MITKIVKIIILFIPVIVLRLFTNAVQPEIETELAMEQFVNPSIQTDTLQRSINYDIFNNTALAVWFVCSLFVFRKEIKECYQKVIS